MILEEIRSILETTGLPVTYYAWPEKAAPDPPYICYLVAYTNNFAADSGVYEVINHLQIELYTDQKEPETEARVESALASFFWQKTETYIESEQCFQIMYEIEV